MKLKALNTVIAAATLALTSANIVLADDWVAERLRGSVLILKGDQWAPLERGDVVSDASYVKTLGNGRVEFTRGDEKVEMAGHTMIQIIDGTRSKFTNVHQHYGTVTVEAEKRNVNHFAVVTPLVAAIVKGTQFVVQIGSAGASVSVDRGTVGVSDPRSGNSTEISPGQGASVSPSGQFKVTSEAGVELPLIRQSGPGVRATEQSDSGSAVGAAASASQAGNAVASEVGHAAASSGANEIGADNSGNAVGSGNAGGAANAGNSDVAAGNGGGRNRKD
ncbi:FecR domain-containing protein [Devosia ureilytica]|uniref:FecR domain-containing protein n=1 Tax=Devosia ureilytica TaxID=2952754 RepID=UPI0022B2745D|nr:FecR domain-containing protein [Devosia ureilytica]